MTLNYGQAKAKYQGLQMIHHCQLWSECEEAIIKDLELETENLMIYMASNNLVATHKKKNSEFVCIPSGIENAFSHFD